MACEDLVGFFYYSVLPIITSLAIFEKETKEVVSCGNCLIENLFFHKYHELEVGCSKL